MTYEHAEAVLVLSHEQGFAFGLAEATMPRGWVLVEQGEGEAGIAPIRQEIAAQRATGGGLLRVILPRWPRRVGTWDRERKGCGW